jgi:hypothetical protein
MRTEKYKRRRFWFEPWGRPYMSNFARLRAWPIFITFSRTCRDEQPRWTHRGRRVLVRVWRGFVAVEWMP